MWLFSLFLQFTIFTPFKLDCSSNMLKAALGRKKEVSPKRVSVTFQANSNLSLSWKWQPEAPKSHHHRYLIFPSFLKRQPTYFPTETITQTVTLSNLKVPQNFQVNESQILEGDNMGKKSINTHDILIQNISFFLFFFTQVSFFKI